METILENTTVENTTAMNITAENTAVDLTLLEEAAVQLTAILTEETGALELRQLEAVYALQESKNKLFKVYEVAIKTLLVEPEQKTLNSLPASLKTVLHDLQVELKRNQTAIKAARDARRFMLKAIRDASLEYQQKQTSYGRNMQPVRRPASGMALAYNQSL